MAKKNKWTQEEVQFITEQYLTIPLAELQQHLPHKTKIAIRNKAYRLGMVKDKADGWNRKYTSRNDCFDEINELSAYWLGFIWADGSVPDAVKMGGYVLSMQLNKRDKEHLEKFLMFVGSNSPIYNVPQKDAVSVCVSNKRIYDTLRRLGVANDKKCRGKFPTIFNDDGLLRCFIRGYFDGDGSVFACLNKRGKLTIRLNFTGCNDFIDTLGRYLNDKFSLNNTPAKDKRSNAWRYAVNHATKCVELLDWLYDGAEMFLTRKKETYDKLKLLAA